MPNYKIILKIRGTDFLRIDFLPVFRPGKCNSPVLYNLLLLRVNVVETLHKVISSKISGRIEMGQKFRPTSIAESAIRGHVKRGKSKEGSQ
jgi:hypothetical protein